MAVIKIDKSKCARDGLCVDICPLGIIEADEEGLPASVVGSEEMCIACGHCFAICPTGALTLHGIAPEEYPEVKKELAITPEQATQFLCSRRSTRNFKKEPVERELLEKILDTTRYAPSGHNLQPVHWLVIHNTDEVQNLAAVIADGLIEMDILPGMGREYKRGNDVVVRGAPHLVVAHAKQSHFDHFVDCVIATAHLNLAAESHGLGGCWAGVLMLLVARGYQPLIDALKLPEGHKAHAAMMLGRPTYKFSRLPMRRSLRVEWR